MQSENRVAYKVLLFFRQMGVVVMETIFDLKTDEIKLNRWTVYALDLPGSMADNLVWHGNIDSLEKLANTDIVDLLKIHGIGEKSIETIKAKMLEIGVEMIDSREEQEKKVSIRKVPFPINLLRFIKEHNWRFKEPTVANDDIVRGIRFAYTSLQDEFQVVLYLRFEKHYTLQEIAKIFSLSSTQIENKIEKAIQTWFKSGDIKYIEEGLSGHINNTIKTKAEALSESKISIEYKRGYDNAIAEMRGSTLEPEKEIDILMTPLEDLDLSVRSCNCLKRQGIETLGEILNLTLDELYKIRNLGRKCIEEIRNKVKDLGLVAVFEKEYDEIERQMVNISNSL